MKAKYDVFISYRRDGGQDTARIIRDELRARGFRVFFDVETLRSGKFNEQLLDRIQECNDFILVCSPGALDRCSDPEDWVRQELACAIANKKNIIPVMLRNFEFPPVETLSKDIRDVYYCNGIPASHEHFDSFISKLTGFLTPPQKIVSLFRSLPFNGRRMATAILVFLLVIGVVLFGGYRLLREPAMFPESNEEIACTDRLLAYSTLNLAVYDSALRVYNDTLEELIKYTQHNSNYQKMYSFDEYAAFGIELIADSQSQLRNIDDMDATLMRDLSAVAGDKINTGDVASMENLIDICINEMKNSLLFFINLYDSNGNDLSDTILSENLTQYRKLSDLERDGVFLSFNDMLLAVDNPDVLNRIKKEILPELTTFYTRQEWNTDRSDISAQMDSVFYTQMGIVSKIEETTKFNEEQLQKLQEAIENIEHIGMISPEESESVEQTLASLDSYIELLENRKTMESILSNDKESAGKKYDEKIDRLKASRDSLSDKYEELKEKERALADLENELAARKDELREKFKPLETDSVDLLWGKALRFRKVNMTDMIEECLDMYETAEDADEWAGIYIKKAKYYFQSIEETGVEDGVIVCFYEPELKQQQYEIGDIIYEVDGEQIVSAGEIKLSKNNEKTPTSVLRFNDSGGFEKLIIDYDPDCGRIALLNLSESE